MDTRPVLSAAQSTGFDLRRVIIFCLFAYGISGAAALFIALNGGLNGQLGQWTFLVLAAWYMPGPALANLLTRLVTGEGFGDLWLRPKFRSGRSAWLGAWVLPWLLVVAGAGVYFVFFPQHFDGSLSAVQQFFAQTEQQTGQAVPLTPWTFVAIQLAQALLIAPLVNAVPTLGEEFGWRAYLQQKFLVLGWRRAMLWMGLIWGAWHWPILAIGYNYGLDYAGAPWLGMVLFVWITFHLGVLFGWLTLRGQSVWPAVIGHGAFNGIAAIGALFVQGEPHPLLGPLAIGLIASLPLALVGTWLWLRAPGVDHTPLDPATPAD